MIRPDKVQFASSIDTYLNYATETADITISGSLPNLAFVSFEATIPYTRVKTRADLYLRNLNNGVKRPVNGGPRQSPYIPVSSETCDQYAQYGSNTVVISLIITNNTGSTINLTPQTIRASAVFYVVPY